ncbi:MAG: hypothetical protein P8080_03440 [Gammaproteobacteria bacterium]
MSRNGGGLRDRVGRLVNRESGEDERLLNLFRNRAELKQAFADLQSRLRRAEENLASQEAATRRAEERLRGVEELLARPGSGYQAMVYFQLRALWRECHERLQALCDELRVAREDRLRRESLMAFNREKQRQLEVLDREIGTARQELETQRAARSQGEAALAAARGLRGLFSRRRLERELARRRQEVEATRRRLADRLDRRSAVDAEPWPSFEGLDVESKREINLAVIALAQELYLHFSVRDLAKKAREAAVGAVQEIDYGSEHQCKTLISTIQQARNVPAERAGWSPMVQARARQLSAEVKFRSERDTVPMASSTPCIDLPVQADGGARRIPLEVNVLLDEYWDPYEVFIP